MIEEDAISNPFPATAPFRIENTGQAKAETLAAVHIAFPIYARTSSNTPKSSESSSEKTETRTCRPFLAFQSVRRTPAATFPCIKVPVLCEIRGVPVVCCCYCSAADDLLPPRVRASAPFRCVKLLSPPPRLFLRPFH